jgi:transcriptional regulator with XRE-family HTH domain
MKISNSNERIRYLMDYFGLNQTEFSLKANIQKSTLSNYLTGCRIPRQDQIDAISSAFNVNPSWLLGYDVPMFNEIQEQDYSDEEILVIEAYRKADYSIKEAVRKLLDIQLKEHKFKGQMTLFDFGEKHNDTLEN